MAVQGRHRHLAGPSPFPRGARRRNLYAMPKPRPLERIDRFAWMTRTAFFVLLAVVCARCVLTEMLRDPLPVLPGSAAPPRGVGPAAGIGLDLLLCIPAMLVLLRRLVDGDYRLRQTWSLWPLAGWGVWALLSTIWAADKFAALVNACHLIGAVGAMFAAIQIVRDAIHVRLAAGAVIGVMLLLVANGINKRLFDVPEMIRQWQDPASPNSRWQYMKDNNLEESDFQFVVPTAAGNT